MATLKNVTISDTGFIELPAGTTGERPGSPTAGMIRFNTDYGKNEIYTGSAWVTTEAENYATGGSVVSSGGYRIHTFTSGTTTFTMAYPGVVEVLLVGGGGGGAGIGGGGGGGGFIYESQQQLPAGNFSVTVGGGGGGEPSHNSLAYPGGDSVIASPSADIRRAVGGGRGLPYARQESPARYGNGGSGGGGPGGHGPSAGGEGGFWPQAPTGHGNPGADHFWHGAPLQGLSTGNNNDQISMEGNGYGSGIVGQGHPGGFGAHGGGFIWAAGNTVIHCGGGGGGAGSSGKPIANSNTFGTGGAGLYSQITGTRTYYALGGGGGTHQPGNPGHYGLGGAHGGQQMGGQAGIFGSTSGETGPANSGYGGGGGVHSSPNAAGPGGSGIVVIRYRE